MRKAACQPLLRRSVRAMRHVLTFALAAFATLSLAVVAQSRDMAGRFDYDILALS
ncbi:hypothetical protein KY389_00930 [Paracoccus bogoriensis]|uniref:hypothetical protein n=1 Tax=Paracoccus bogoriensis TaxID=242065 RepID=UPI001CA568D5|nr:hypothetical protein [Paracoccus bogoriensis]MBW7055256.1 hypothetical protein [Paracoccus bogoriensis]